MTRSTRWRDGGWLLALLAAGTSRLVQGGVILEPPGAAQGPDVSFVMLHGADIAPEAYTLFAKAVQRALAQEARVWVGIPDVDNTQPSTNVSAVIFDTEAEMTAEGMQATHRFVGGHSLGGVLAQEHARKYPSTLTGGVLIGASLLRATYNLTTEAFPVPVLTLGGEKDGLQRVSRMAEGFFMAKARAELGRCPVVVLRGMNHMGPVEGSPPPVVAARDLKTEISYVTAREEMAALIADFVRGLMNGTQAGVLNKALGETEQLVGPLIQAMVLEGSEHLLRPCNSDRPSPHCPFYPAWPPQPEGRTPSDDTHCTCGTPWAENVAQRWVAGLEDYGVDVVVVDAHHDVRDTRPYHHAHLWNNCSMAEVTGGTCTLNLTTVTQLVYPPLDEMDTGLFGATAQELRVKMKSRQSIYMATIDDQAKLEDTDAGSFCAEINKQALLWALRTAPPATADRFKRLGTQMIFLPDIRHQIQIGPVWINAPLRLIEALDLQTGRWQLRVRSPAMVTDVTQGIYPDSAGYHYCKLLSPARAMEWIYVDGLRHYDQI